MYEVYSKWISAVHAQWSIFSCPRDPGVSGFPRTREVRSVACCVLHMGMLPPKTISTRLCVLYFTGDLKDFQG